MRGQVISNTKVASFTPSDLASLLTGNVLGQELLTLSFQSACTVAVYEVTYYTVDGKGASTTGSAALMIPNTGASASCAGSRPIVLYAHGTNPNRNYDLAQISASDDGEGLLVAAIFASQGFIVVAPNYAGYDSSSLPYHPYLVAAQQSADMIDALTAARRVLPESAASGTSASAQLFITGYSQGGFVAMATHRAMQAAGMPVTASGPMSGPYALAAFADAVFEGEVNLSATVNMALVASSYQNTYGNLSPSAMFASPYDTDVIGLLPSITPLSTLYSEDELPQNALFSSTPPAAQYASMTPATTPADLAEAFAQGFGSPFFITNAYRLSYLEDAQANPDGGFPMVTTGAPATNPGNSLRQDFKSNDLRNWSPRTPVLLCGGNQDPDVFFFNLQLMQEYWGAHPGSATPVYVDIDSSGNPYSTEKSGFAAARGAVATTAVAQGATDGGQAAVLAVYHATLVPPFCASVVESFFSGYVQP
jgi:hypothetical protein